jgi:hypothetical protein
MRQHPAGRRPAFRVGGLGSGRAADQMAGPQRDRGVPPAAPGLGSLEAYLTSLGVG